MSTRLDGLRAAVEAEFAARKAGTFVEPAEEVEPVEPEITEGTPEPVPGIEEPPAPQDVVEEPVHEGEKPSGKRTVYIKKIDLGDGNVQTFKASTKDELIEKIFNAQVNASKRIKELKAENRKIAQSVQPDPETPSRTYQPRDLSEDEEIEVINKLQSSPKEAVAKTIEALFGGSIDEIRADISYGRQAKQREEILASGRQFMQAHPEYPVTSQNEKLMGEYLQKNKLAWTLKNLEIAYADLQEAGLVIPIGSNPQSDDIDPDTEEEIEETPAPVTPTAPVVIESPAPASTASVEVPRRKRAVVGVSSRHSAAHSEPEPLREASVEDLLKLSPSERRRIVMSEFGRQA